MSQLKSIKVNSALKSEALSELLSTLESVLPVRFDFDGVGAGGEALQIISAATDVSHANAASAVLILPEAAGEQGDSEVRELRGRFADDGAVPFPFRDRAVVGKIAGSVSPLKLSAGEKALLTCERGVIWSVAERNGSCVFRTGLRLPTIPVGGNLHDVLNGERCLEVLPLLHFVRRCTGFYDWQRPPVRAQFMFDDPNLHWPTFGLVRYGELARRAERENYHVSFATVPLDGWWTNRTAANVFKAQSKRLSLCIHGNDHTKRELAQSYTDGERVGLLQQAIRRIEKLEQRSGVSVSRVMVPPHGACSHDMLALMPPSGFESACISAGSLRSHNRTRPWTKKLGYTPVEMIEQCPVLPRWAFTGTTLNTILLAAFLDQAIVLRGHHQDLKDGIELLDNFARMINGLGAVQWGSMAEISRSCFATRRAGETLQVQPWVNCIAVQPTTGVSEVVLPGEEWSVTSVSGKSLIAQGGKVALAESLILQKRIAPSAIREVGRGLPVAALVRRLLTEGRDRVQGVIGVR